MLTKLLQITLVIFVLIQYACVYDDSISKFKQFENAWKECYDSNFQFIDDHNINSSEYVKCKLDEKNVLINAGSLGYQELTLYSSSSITYDTTISLPLDNSFNYKILISFLESEYLTGFYIQLDYPKDSLNYVIQKTFSNEYVNCATNFVDNGFQYYIGTYCEPSGVIRFSTIYSLIENQNIEIINFSYNLIDGIWYYHLEYSSDHLELTNESWNSREKHDSYGHEVNSKILVENIQITDLHAIIEFELKAD